MRHLMCDLGVTAGSENRGKVSNLKFGFGFNWRRDSKIIKTNVRLMIN